MTTHPFNDIIQKKVVEMIDEKVRFEKFVESGGFKRANKNIIAGRAVKPCGRECEDYGYKIVEYFDHKSLENFKNLMDNSEFLIRCASISPNPKDCTNYFYNFVNENLKRNKSFRTEFLKAIYLNDNVYTLESINWFVETFGYERENAKLLNDLEFKKCFEARLGECIAYPQYHYDGQVKKNLTTYKKLRNDIKILNQNREDGLREILSTFKREKTESDIIDEWLFGTSC